jgi:predicted nucleic acid-binding protein
MNEVLGLDTGPAGQIAHPRSNQEITRWLQTMLAAGASVIWPEIVDYELRRNILLEIARGRMQPRSLQRLDQLRQALAFLPINSEVMLKAADLWAATRRRGQPTASDQALDGDVILAAQALQVGGVVITENPKHLSLFVETANWQEFEP